MQLIKISGLYFKYPESVDFVLENVNCEVGRGDRIGIVGHNGGGKSTLLKLIKGMIEPSDNGLLINDECSVAYLPQDYSDRKSVV